jgi:hypothetical protein
MLYNIQMAIDKSLMIKIAIVAVVAFFLYRMYDRETLDNISFGSQVALASDASAPVASPSQQQATLVSQPADTTLAPVAPTSVVANLDQLIGTSNGSLTTDQLLPQYDSASAFAKDNPVAALLKEQNFLQAGYHIGINTVVQSNKIPYNDIRSLPPIPKTVVGPWMQSSYDEPAGSGRRHLDIGV